MLSNYDLSSFNKKTDFTVLIVDDQPTNIQLIYQLLKYEYQILMATSGKQAISVCKESQPDLVLLDVIMPEIDGLQTCRLLKSDPTIANIPVIFITGLTAQEDQDACWEAGGVDFLKKPFNVNTLKNRIKAHLTLKHQADLLRSLAYLDGLTGLNNRRYFDQHLKSHLAQAYRKKQPLSLLLIDIDYFKQYNDTFGHLEGDDCLKKVATALHQCCRRPTDIAARYGGEEFAIILPETSQEGIWHVASLVQDQIKALSIDHPAAENGFLTISIGGAVDLEGTHSSEQLIALADKMLYQAKETGRNQTCITCEKRAEHDKPILS